MRRAFDSQAGSSVLRRPALGILLCRLDREDVRYKMNIAADQKRRNNNRLLTKKLRARQGFTLPEILVAMCLLAMLLPFLLRCFFYISEQQKQLAALLELEDNLLLAVESLTNDIVSSTAVLDCDEKLLILWQDRIIYYDLGDDIEAGNHLYQLEGEVLYRRENIQQNRQPMANFIDELTFSYWDETGQPTTEAEAVRKVGFSIAGSCQRRQVRYQQIVNLAGEAYL